MLTFFGENSFNRRAHTVTVFLDVGAQNAAGALDATNARVGGETIDFGNGLIRRSLRRFFSEPLSRGSSPFRRSDQFSVLEDRARGSAARSTWPIWVR